MSTLNSLRGRTALTLAHVAGLIDMVALPVWIGVLIQHYRYVPERAGMIVTSFLFGVLVSSLIFAPRFNSLPKRLAASAGFALSALCFFAIEMQPLEGGDFFTFVGLHALAGLGVGCSLSFAHGAMGRSANPHRMFGVAHFALGVFALLFLSLVPQAVQSAGATMLFRIFFAVMLIASAAMAIGFPRVSESSPNPANASGETGLKVPRAAWLVIGVVMCLNINQSMVFGFVERIGSDRGFGVDQVNAALMALGFVNLFPGGLAALLQKRLSPIIVGMGGLCGQSALALTLANATAYPPYAVAASFFVSMAIFTHVFLFGLLSRLDMSGRAVAATPAMIMLGASMGPALGGWIVQRAGYQGLGWAATTVACIGIGVIWLVARELRRSPETPSLYAEAHP